MALGLTQIVTEMSTRNVSWGVKAAGAWGLRPYQLHVPIVLKSGCLTLLEPSGPVQACDGIALPLMLRREMIAVLRTIQNTQMQNLKFLVLTFRHRASCILGQAFHYSPENAFYIFNQQIYLII